MSSTRSTTLVTCQRAPSASAPRSLSALQRPGARGAERSVRTWGIAWRNLRTPARGAAAMAAVAATAAAAPAPGAGALGLPVERFRLPVGPLALQALHWGVLARPCAGEEERRLKMNQGNCLEGRLGGAGTAARLRRERAACTASWGSPLTLPSRPGTRTQLWLGLAGQRLQQAAARA